MRFMLSFAFCSALALVAVQSRAADDKDAKAKDQAQQRETVAKPMTEKQKKAAENRLKKELDGPYKKWMEEEVGWIITDEERTAWKRLQTDDERQAFIEEFWLRRDPTPDTEENEYKEEHYRRIQWANDRYASGIPGWKTDRGMVYIKYGPPDDIDDHSSGGPGVRPIEEGGGETTFFPYQIWRYRHIDGVGEDVEIEFLDKSMTNEYRITIDPSEKDALLNVPGAGLTMYEQMGLANKDDRFTRTDGTRLGVPTGVPMPAKMDQFDRMAQFANLGKAPVIPTKYKDLEATANSTIRYNLLPMRVRTDYFPITGASVNTSLTIQWDRKDLQYRQREGVAEAEIHLSVRIENMTHRRVIPLIEEAVVTPPVPVDMLEQASQGSAVFQRLIPLIPGRYRLTVVAKDMVGGNLQTYDAALDVPRFDEDTFGNSSLVLADVLEKVATNSVGAGQFVIGTDKVRPRVNATFKRDETMYIYMQVYNFEPGEKTRKPDGMVTYQIVKSGTNEVIAEISDDVSTLTRGGGGAQVIAERKVPLKDFQPGDYILKMKVTDKNRDETLTPSATFKVI
jgi:GWxTD domain-containing protein